MGLFGPYSHKKTCDYCTGPPWSGSAAKPGSPQPERLVGGARAWRRRGPWWCAEHSSRRVPRSEGRAGPPSARHSAHPAASSLPGPPPTAHPAPLGARDSLPSPQPLGTPASRRLASLPPFRAVRLETPGPSVSTPRIRSSSDRKLAGSAAVMSRPIGLRIRPSVINTSASVAICGSREKGLVTRFLCVLCHSITQFPEVTSVHDMHRQGH